MIKIQQKHLAISASRCILITFLSTSRDAVAMTRMEAALSAVAIPKLDAGRPPVVPPGRTTFSDGPAGEPDPIDAVLAESARRLIKTIPHTHDDRLDLLLRLLQQRRRVVEGELAMERMFAGTPLPPSSFDYFSLDYLIEPENKPSRRYVILLNELDEGIAAVERKIRMRKREPASSED